VAYYNAVRPHQALDNNSPQPDIDPRQVAGSSPFLRSAGFITVTSAPPDHRDRDPLIARLLLGCPSPKLHPVGKWLIDQL
jgi:hypothetical protein